MSGRAVETIPRKTGWMRRWAFRLGVAFLILIALLGGAYLGREQIIAPFVISRARDLVREATGLELQVATLRGNWWSDVELLNLKLAGGTPTSELTSLSIGRLKANFTLLDLIRGNLEAVSSVEIDAASVVLDLDRPRPAQKRSSSNSSAATPFPWPTRAPTIIARDVNLILQWGSGSKLEAAGIDLVSVVPAPDGTLQWDVSAKRAGYSDPHFGERHGSLQTRISYRTGVFEIPRVEFDGKTFARELHCDLRPVFDGRLSFDGVLDLLGGAQEFRAAIAANELEAWVDTHDLDVAALLHELKVDPAWSGRASVGGVLRVPFAAPGQWSAYSWGRADAPAFENRQFDLALFAGDFDSDHIDVREGTLVRGANTLKLSKFGVSLAETKLDEILRSLSGFAALEVFDPSAILKDASIDVQNAAARVQLAKLDASFSAGGIHVQSGKVETDLGGLVVQRGRAAWGSRDLPWYEGLSLDLDLALSFVDIAPLAALFNQGDARGSLSGTVKVHGAALRPSGNFKLDGDGLAVAGFEFGQVGIEANADQQHLEVTKLEIVGGLGRASASGDFDYASGVISNAHVNARTTALDLLSNHRASAALAEIDATVDGAWRDPHVKAHVQAGDLFIEKLSIEKLDLEAEYSLDCVQIEKLTGNISGIAVEAGGKVCRDVTGGTCHVTLERAKLAHEELNLALEAPLEVGLKENLIVLQGLRVAGSAGKAIADISWSPDEQDVSIEASELYPMQLLRPFLRSGVVIEGVQGSLSLKRTPLTLAADGALSVADLRLYENAPPASVSFHGQLRDHELTIAELVLSSPNHFALNVSGRVPTDLSAGEWLSDGPLELAGEGSVSDLQSLPWSEWGIQSVWGGEVRAAFRLEGTTSDVSGVVDAKLDVMRTTEDSVLDRARLNAFQFDGRATLGDGIRLDNARFAVPKRASAIIDGHVGLRVSPREWLRTRTIDWRPASVDVTAGVSAQDLEFIAGLSNSLRRTGGALQGDLCVKGTLGEPIATGALELSHGEVRLNNALAAFENLSAHFDFDGRQIRVVSLTGDYGAAPFTAGGTLEFTREEPRLDLHIEGKGLLLAREEGLRLRADAELKVAGPLSTLLLSGKVIIVEGRFSKDFALLTLPGSSGIRRPRELELPFLRQAPWANIEFNVDVSARKAIRVETNIARGTVEPLLHLGGSGAAPRLDGTLLIGATHVKLPATALEVTSGALTFRGGSSLAPELDIRAITRVRGFDITAQISGTSVEPEVLFTSSPPLASEDLAVLVLTGQLPESALTSQGGEAAAQTVAVYLGRDLLTRWLGVEEGSDDPISERLEFYRGAEVSQTGIESTDFIFRLTPNPKGKSTILYLRAEQDIYERVNFGVKFLFRFQ